VFGDVVDDHVKLTREGKILEKEWLRTPGVRLGVEGVELDEFVVMPNHLHGILIIGDTRRGVLQYATKAIQTKTVLHSPSQTLGAIVRGFKSTTAKQINLICAIPGVPVWQRNYYEHVIRNDTDLRRIRAYIRNNPPQWTIDEENPERAKE
jgi:REP element-mobilizing transposase RayT